jgi:acetyltransferase-like isoleucine patch superfamily enzyme
MSWMARLRRGEGPFWGRLKGTARAVLSFHLPVNAATRPLFGFLYRVHVTVRETWIWMRRFFWYEPLFRSQCAAVGSNLWMEELPYISGSGRIVVGNRVRLSGKSTIAFGRAGGAEPEFQIGDDTFIGHACAFSISSSVRIGRHCLLASGVLIFDMDGHPLDAEPRRAGADGLDQGGVVAGLGGGADRGEAATASAQAAGRPGGGAR